MNTVWDQGLEKHILGLAKLDYKGQKFDQLVPLVREIHKICIADEAANETIKTTVMKDASFQELYQKKHVMNDISLEELATYPAGSLGKVFADHMIANKLEVHFIEPFEITNEASYLFARVSQTHDIKHVILGYDTSPMGEFALKAFDIAQYQSLVSTNVMLGTMLGMFNSMPQTIHGVFDLITAAYQRGRNTRLLSAVMWEDHWGDNLEELKSRLEIPS